MPDRVTGNPANVRIRWRAAADSPAIVWLAMAPGLCLLAWWIRRYVWALAWTTFAGYDDEGYILVSVREFLSGKALYTSVFSQYGPFYYLYRQAESLFYNGLPTHDITRAGTAAMWLLIPAALGIFIWLTTRSRLIAALVWAHTTLYLHPLINEPGHPQQLVLLLIALLLVVAALPLSPGLVAIGLGVLTGAILMTKINIGVYTAFPVLISLAVFQKTRWAARAFWITCGMAVLVPVAVMRHNLSGPTLNYAAHVPMIIAASCLAASVYTREDNGKSRKVLTYVAATAAACFLVAVYIIVRGTGLFALIDGILLLPLRFSNAFLFAMATPVDAVAFSMAGCAVALLFRFSSGWQAFPGAWRTSLCALKLVAGIYVLSKSASPVDMLSYAATPVWLLLVPCERREFSGRSLLARILLVLMAAFQTLQAYPIAGSQCSWSTLLILVTAYMLIVDGAKKILPAASQSVFPILTRAAASGMAMLAIATLFLARSDLGGTEGWVKTFRPLHFPGAEKVRVTSAQFVSFHWEVANMQAHCDGLVTMPGMNSLQLWSGLPFETGFNTTAWVTLLNASQQQAILDGIRKKQRPCAAYSPAIAQSWLRRNTIEELRNNPLVRYILDLTPVPGFSRVGGTEIRTTPANATEWKVSYLKWGPKKFGYDDVLDLPLTLLSGNQPLTVRGWFQTQYPGSILGAQKDVFQNPVVAAWHPLIFVGTDGKLRASLDASPAAGLTAATKIMDGKWHHFAVTRDKNNQALYVDGSLAASGPADELPPAGHFQLGTAYSRGIPGATGDWMPWLGDLRNVGIAAESWSATQVANDLADRPK